MRGANWIGTWNPITLVYDDIDYENIWRTLQVIQSMVDTHKDDPIVIGITPGTTSI